MDSIEEKHSDQAQGGSDVAHRQSIGALFLLCLIGFLNSADAKVVGAIAELIKRDLRLTDTQLGLLTGFSFSVCYAVVSLPIAYLSDRGNRARIIAVALAFWSMMTALCGLSGSYLKLLFARTCVALGESAYNPAAFSLVADYFDSRLRARAMAALTMAAALGTLASFTVGGWLAQEFGWRAVFLSLSLPGLVMAAAAWLWLPEPRRQKNGTAHPASDVGALAGIVGVIAKPGYLLMTAGGAAISFSIGVFLVWSSALFQRVYGWTIGDTGMALGILFGLAGVASPLVTAYLGDRLSARRRTAHLDVVIVLNMAAVPIVAIGLLAPNAPVTLAAIGLAYALSAGWIPNLLATTRMLVDSHEMAVATAIVGLSANLLGLGGGPLAIGAVSDALQPRFGADALRYAFLVCAIAFGIAVICLSLASRALRSEHGKHHAERH